MFPNATGFADCPSLFPQLKTKCPLHFEFCFLQNNFYCLQMPDDGQFLRKFTRKCHSNCQDWPFQNEVWYALIGVHKLEGRGLQWQLELKLRCAVLSLKWPEVLAMGPRRQLRSQRRQGGGGGSGGEGGGLRAQSHLTALIISTNPILWPIQCDTFITHQSREWWKMRLKDTALHLTATHN